LPDEETHLVTKDKFREDLVALLGGRVAEEIRFGDITTGASNDLERVAAMARAMVTQWGMSERLGPIRYGEREDLVFLGREISERRNYSDRVAQAIDEEIHQLVDEAHTRCHQLLSAHWDKVDVVAMALLEVETLDAQQFEALMRGEDPFRPTQHPGSRITAPRDETARQDKRTDTGVDLGGPVPAPA
jgi:cell division protease FtsH